MIKSKIEFKKTAMTKRGQDQKEDLETIQKSIEEAAKKVAHTTKSDREKEVRRTLDVVRIRGEVAAKCTKSKQEKGTLEGEKESQGRSGCEMQPDACKEEPSKKASDGVVCQWQIHG